ncbi:MAG TPA: ABC transporter substrate-binding protein [Vicinamibacterales bacterium]
MARHLRQFPAVCTILLAAACNGAAPASKSAAAGPARGGTLTVTLRSEPSTFNRYAPGGEQAAVDAVTRLTQASLVRLNRLTGEFEPWLAETWTASPDGRVFTLTLRDGVAFSDGVPFTSDDVVFSFRALYDPVVKSALASGVMVQGKPLQVSAPDPRTVVITFPAPFVAGVALLDNVPIYPKHQLQAALDAHTFGAAWGPSTKPGTMAVLGPFVPGEYVQGQRLTFTRNPRYWRKDAAGVPLPYLDAIVMEFVASQDAEILRMEAGSIDLMTVADIRPEDVAALRQLRDQGALQLVDVGTSVDPNTLWFNLAPGAAALKAKPYLARTELRQAIAYAVDRDAIVNTVYLGAAVPVYGPVTPGNRTWYSGTAPRYPHDVARAKALLAGIGLTDRNGDGMLEDAAGRPARFSILTQGGSIRERTATVIQEQLRQAGLTVDVVPLDPPSLYDRFGKGDYESIYYGFQASSFDPAMNLDVWVSGGSAHVWNFGAPAPWEKTIDDLMQRQVAAPTLAERQRLFAEVQKIFGENLPEICFVAPKVSVAMSRRVGGAVPVLLDPKILWNPDTLYVTGR